MQGLTLLQQRKCTGSVALPAPGTLQNLSSYSSCKHDRMRHNCPLAFNPCIAYILTVQISLHGAPQNLSSYSTLPGNLTGYVTRYSLQFRLNQRTANVLPVAFSRGGAVRAVSD